MMAGIGDRFSVARKMLLTLAAVSTPIFVGFSYGQELKAPAQATEHLAFEVASVRLNKSLPPFAGAAAAAKVAMLQQMALQYLPGGRFSARGIPIPILIFEAYNVSLGASRRIAISPEFEKSTDEATEWERYDIEAVAEKEAIPANASREVRIQKMRLMLQTLLADRFKLRISYQTKEVPVYAIAIGKNGPKLPTSAIDEAQCDARSDDRPQIARLVAGVGDPVSCHAFVGGQGRGLRGEAVDMSDFAQAIEGIADRPVVNQTGLNGLYKIDILGWSPLLLAAPRSPGTEPTAEERAAADRPTLSDILQNLGLQLESTKAPIEMFVVEHFERAAQNQ
jgi:uncharacterized protein (TIGR03435 family)